MVIIITSGFAQYTSFDVPSDVSSLLIWLHHNNGLPHTHSLGGGGRKIFVSTALLVSLGFPERFVSRGSDKKQNSLLLYHRRETGVTLYVGLGHKTYRATVLC